jgi:hypothetical protein
MIRLCNKCNCELNGTNCVKKDAKRFRKICRSCFREKRNASRILKKENQSKHLCTLIEKNIVKIDFEPLLNDLKPKKELLYSRKNSFLWKIVDTLKNIIKEVNNAL